MISKIKFTVPLILSLFFLAEVFSQVRFEPHQTIQNRRFRIEISGSRSMPLASFSETDSLKRDEKPNSKTGGYITELTLVTFVTPDDNTFTDLALRAADTRKPELQTITITELAKDKSVIKTFVYDNSLLTSCDFPSVDAAGGEMLKRTSTWKPEILTVSGPAGKKAVYKFDKTTGKTLINPVTITRDIRGRVSADNSAALNLNTLISRNQKKEPASQSLAIASPPPRQRPINSKYFKFEVKGIGGINGVTSVDAGKLTLSVEVATQGDKPDYREYTYGSHEYGDLTFTVQEGPGSVKLQEWADKAAQAGERSEALRRDCSLYLLARNKTTVLRTINLFGCYPTSYSDDYSSSSEVKEITFTCNVDRIEETKG